MQVKRKYKKRDYFLNFECFVRYYGLQDLKSIW